MISYKYKKYSVKGSGTNPDLPNTERRVTLQVR
jgi:hypothetical protein